MVANSRPPSALLALVLLLTVTIAQSAIDSRSPSVARGSIGKTAQLVCATTGNEHAVSWKRLRDNQMISHNSRISADDPRFSVQFDENEHTWFLYIQDSTQKDEGEYLCTVITSSGFAEKKVRLTMIEASDTYRWRLDNRCGHFAECDPLGAFPCCSASGWCGFTQLHCDCVSCVDYRRRPNEATPTPASEISQSAIDSRSPSVARGIIGKTAQLVCATTGNENAVSWKRLRDNQIISHNRRISVDDPRFSVQFDGDEHTWFLYIQDSTQEDEGEYLCTVKTSSGFAGKKVRLTMIEASNTYRWQLDNRCGHFAECDPLGAFPCCSASGWCGFTQRHCDCDSCVDYRLRPTQATPTPASEIPRCANGYLEVSSRCLLLADDVKTWSQATQFCASKAGHLITFETFGQLMEVVGFLTKLQTTEIVTHSPRVPMWVGISTQGHMDYNGTLRWRWVMGQSKLKDTSLLMHLDKANGERCGFLHHKPMVTILDTGDCEKLLLPLCERGD